MYSVSSKEFTKYGAIIESPIRDHLKGKLNYEVGKESGSAFWEYETSVILEPSEGVGILYINDKLTRIQKFIFNKPIRMNPLTQFSISSIDEIFSFNLYSNSVRTTVFNDEIFHEPGITSELNINKIYTFLYQNKSKNFYFSGEKHSFYELTFIDNGVMSCIIDDEEVILRQGELLLLLPDQPHQMKALNDKGLSFLTVTFDMNMKDSSVFDKKILNNDSNILSIIKNLIFELKMKSKKRSDMILSLTTQLIVALYRSIVEINLLSASNPTLKTGIKSDVVDKCVAIISSSICEKISIKDLASKLNISTSYLSKIFHDNLNCSITEYVIKYRIELAKNMITAGQNSYYEIANKLGYCSAAFFTEQFKIYTGMTPKEFDKSLEKF